MSATFPHSSSPTLPGPLREPYATASAAALLGRSWQLCRRYPKQSLLGILPPVCLMMLQSLLIVVMNVVTTSTQYGHIDTITGFLGITGLWLSVVVVSFLASIAWLVSFVALSRFYFSAMMFETPLSLKDCLRYIQSSWLMLLVWFIPWIVLGICFVVIDLIIIFITGVIGVLLSSLFTLAAKLPWVILALCVIFFLLGTICLIFFWALFSTQMLLQHLPLVIIANADMAPREITKTSPELPWLDVQGLPAEQRTQIPHHKFGISMRVSLDNITAVLRQAFSHVFANYPKALAYSSIWLFFIFVFVWIWLVPAYIWMIVEVAVSTLHHGSKDSSSLLLVKNVFQVFGSLASSFSVPIYVSGATVFWYDSSVNKDGLDLRLWLASLRTRWLSRQKA